MSDRDSGQFRRLIDSSVDELDGRVALTVREREIAHGVADMVTRGIGEILRDRPANQRLAKIELELDDMRAYRLRMTGAGDDNGRIGKLTREVEALRHDVGPSPERQAERATIEAIGKLRRRVFASLLGAVATVAAAAWGYVRMRDAAAHAAGRAAIRIEHLERDLNHLMGRRLTPDPTRLQP